MNILAEPWFQDLTEGGPSCWNVQQLLYDRVRQLPEQERMNAPVRLFADVMALVLEPTDRNPLRPRVPSLQRPVGSLAAPDLDLLGEAEAVVTQPDVRARLLDVLWTRRRGEELGHRTVRAYLDAADHLAQASARGDTPASRLHRAHHIARMMRWDEGLLVVRERYLALVDLEAAWDFEGLQLGELAPLFGPDVAGDIAKRVENAARTAMASASAADTQATTDWDWSRAALKVAAECYRAAKMTPKRQEMIELRARSYGDQADWLALRGGSLLVQANLLGRAVRAMREAGIAADIVDAVHARMRDRQRESVSELKPIFTTSYDCTEQAHAAMERVSGLRFGEAIRALVELSTPMRLASLRKSAEKSARTYIASYLLPRVHIDDEGRNVAKSSVMSADDGDDALLPTMREHTLIAQQYTVNASVLPAMQTIALEHPATLRDWMTLLEECPLVDSRRVGSLAYGLSAGLQLNMLVAVPVLVPQVEYLVRKMVESRMVTTTLEPDATQREVVLGTLLESPEMSLVIGSDWAWDLRVLLTDQAGRNLRNGVAHGLLHDGDISSTTGIYLWFTALRLLMLIGVVAKGAPVVADTADDDEADPIDESDDEE